MTGNMDHTITAIDTIALRIPLDIWAPAPMSSQGVPRTHEPLGATCMPNAFYIGPAYLAALHCVAAKEKDSPLERMFADFGFTPFSKTVPVINGGIEVPQGPGLGGDPEDDLIAQFRV